MKLIPLSSLLCQISHLGGELSPFTGSEIGILSVKASPHHFWGQSSLGHSSMCPPQAESSFLYFEH